MTICRVSSVALIAGLLCVASVGCSSTSVESLRAEPSPSMVSLAETWQSNENKLIRGRDLTTRQIIPDINMITLQDRPRRMNMLVIP